jgi:hypothetical protein
MLALVSSAWKLDAEFDRTTPVIASKLEDKDPVGFDTKRRAVAVFRLRVRGVGRRVGETAARFGNQILVRMRNL